MPAGRRRTPSRRPTTTPPRRAGPSVVDIARIHRSRLWRVGRFHGPVLRFLGERLGRDHVRFGELALRLAHRDHLLQVLQLQVARLQPILRAGDLVIDLRDLILARVLLLPQVLLRQGPLELRLGLLTAAHEAGHLALARMMGMRVETFSLGFGPRIWGSRRGETDYRLSALPLGGYCKIAGFTPDDPAAQDPSDPGSYMNKPAWRRFLVIAAGPGVNYLVAFLIIAALYASHGFLDLTTTRIEVIPGGPAAAAGLQTGDQVVAVDGAPVDSFDDLRRELQKRDAGAQRRIEVLRDGARRAFTVRPENGTISVKLDRVMVRLPFAEAVPRALHDVWALNAATVGALWDAIRGKGTASLAGPIAIVRQASAEVKRGIADFASILANISVGLALFNFLPVPALDGGRLVFLGVELITRRKVNQRLESVVHVVGLLLLLGLLVSVVVFGDLQLGKRLFSRGGCTAAGVFESGDGEDAQDV